MNSKNTSDNTQAKALNKTDVMQSVLFEDDLVTYETALLAREKGFDIDCGWKLRKLDDGTFTHTNCSDLGVEQPTQSLLQRWLREVHGWQVNVDREDDYWKPVLIEFKSGNKYKTIPAISISYETMLEIGLQEALKLIK